MWPELCARRLVISPLTQTEPTCFSSSALDLPRQFRDGQNLARLLPPETASPKSHCDLDLLIRLTF